VGVGRGSRKRRQNVRRLPTPTPTPPHKGEGNTHGECARLRHPLSNHSPPTRRTPWRKARCAATRKRRNPSRTRTKTRAPPPPRRSPACTARPIQSPTARNSRRGAQRQTPSSAGGGSTREARRGGAVRQGPHKSVLDARPARHVFRMLEQWDVRRSK
jgi:hypothetical protein